MVYLIVVNLIAMLISLVIYVSLNSDYKRLYILGVSLSLAVLAIFSIVKYGIVNLTLTDVAMILYRGGLILALTGGAFSCFVATKLAKKE
jgi:hypothetical protein